MKVLSSAHPDKYTWKVWCPSCGALLEVIAADMTWVRVQQNKRGQPHLLACECANCKQRIDVSAEGEYRFIPKIVVKLIKLMTAERRKPKAESEPKSEPEEITE